MNRLLLVTCLLVGFISPVGAQVVSTPTDSDKATIRGTATIPATNLVAEPDITMAFDKLTPNKSTTVNLTVKNNSNITVLMTPTTYQSLDSSKWLTPIRLTAATVTLAPGASTKVTYRVDAKSKPYKANDVTFKFPVQRPPGEAPVNLTF